MTRSNVLLGLSFLSLAVCFFQLVAGFDAMRIGLHSPARYILVGLGPLLAAIVLFFLSRRAKLDGGAD